MARMLVTGAAGFIGFHVARRLLERGDEVVGIDNLNDYYDVDLKRARLAELRPHAGFTFERLDLADRDGVAELFERQRPEVVVNLAAQAGVRYGRTHPHAYVDANLTGFVNVLEGCRHHGVRHLVFASSSSVYGANRHVPFAEADAVDHPVSLYAATKRAGELLAHSYAHLYGIPTTGLRFFTVYGPWGRPDMAVYAFTRKMLAGETLQLFNAGDMSRDFTYIDDVAACVERVIDAPAAADPAWESGDAGPATSFAPFRLYNLGNHHPEPLMTLVEALEQALGVKARTEARPMPPEDVQRTYAAIDLAARDFGFAPTVGLHEGIRRFVAWYEDYTEGS